MKAIVYERYGPPEVLQLQEVAKPTPRNNEVLIRIHATTVTATDCQMRKGEPYWGRIFLGFRKPKKKILGIELAGEVEVVGANVKRFNIGDPVFGAAMMEMSCWAEYVCLPEKSGLAVKPANMTFEEAAAFCDGALTALTFLKDVGKIKRGQKVLINGASGSVGTFAIQLAKYYGAEVTGVCSTGNVELVKSLGADMMIDYTKEDFTKNTEAYDIIYDTVGKSSFLSCKRALRQNGAYLATLPTPKIMLQLLWTSIIGNKKVKTGVSKSTPERLSYLKELIENGEIKSMIDRRYPLDEIAEAHRYVDKGHKRGNVVITVKHE